MAYLSFDQIQKSSRMVTANLTKSASSPGKQVFLSHSSSDDKYVTGVTSFLSEFGGKVYSDNGDKRLPKPPSPTTADILRGEIAKAQRMVVMISEGSANSGWIPWELGLADGKHGLNNVAVLPIAGTTVEEAWARREYLGLYPVIRYTTVKDNLRWILDLPNGNYYFLSDWLK